jgi:hypothetical protein
MTEEPKLIIPEGTLKIHQPNWYKVDVEKLHHQRLEDVAYLFATMMVADDYEYFDKVKKFLIIPEEPKTLEEISQELDEKFEKLIEQTKRNFNASKLTGERNYEWNFDRIFDNFTYALENGSFPLKYTLTTGVLDGSYLVSDGSCGVKFSSPSFVVKHGSSHQGYYTIGDDGYYRFYVEKKPNVVFRWFVYKLMGFQWIDEVL